jgi:hypothetical protein
MENIQKEKTGISKSDIGFLMIVGSLIAVIIAGLMV